MIIGISGFNGFVGKSISDYLKSCGHVAINVDPILKGNSEHNELGLEKIDWLFHFGAHTSIEDSLENPFGTYRNNLKATYQALEIANKYRSKFLYLSSYVYGDPRYTPIDEEHEIGATNPYMGSKYICELICQQICKFCTIRLIILRAFNIYGIAHKPGRLVSDLIQACVNKEPMILNDPYPRRDYLYIKDFISLLIKVINDDNNSAGVFNVGYGESYSNFEVVELFNRLTGNTIEIITSNTSRPSDIMNCLPDITKVKQQFLWQPQYSLSDGLSEIIGKLDLV